MKRGFMYMVANLHHDLGDFGEEVMKKVAKENNLVMTFRRCSKEAETV